MTIDINKLPTRKATSFERICMELYNENTRYVIVTSDGNEHSVQFSEKSLDEFQKNKTVSQFLKEMTDGINDTINKYKNALETNIHPYWTRTAKEMMNTGVFIDNPKWTGRYIEVDLMMNESQQKHIQKEIDRLSNISGQALLYKIELQ
jgi:hypothetical protein